MSRIIAGSRGGRRIAMPPGDRTRPTTDRVREALFSAVTAWAGTAAGPPSSRSTAWPSATCTPVRAPSGWRPPAVAPVTCSWSSAIVALHSSPGATPKTSDCLSMSSSRRLNTAAEVSGQPYDVVFADPPYELDTAIVSAQIEQLVTNTWVNAGSLIVVERSRRTPSLVWPDVAAKRWTRAYGETILAFGSIDQEPDEPREVQP